MTLRPLSTRASLLAASILIAISGSMLAQEPAAAPATPAPAKKAPAKPYEASLKDGARFMDLHTKYLERGKGGPIGVLFLGDSITEGWNNAKETWEASFGKYQPANFGISGDRTEHVLWRIENGELDGIKPKVVVLMIGTNNSGANEAVDITKGVTTIVEKIHQKLPETDILLLAVFPRGPRMKDGVLLDNTVQMERITAVNAELAKLDNGKSIRFLDIGPKFLGPDGKIPNEIMPDQLHLSKQGYVIWAEAITPLLAEMMAAEKTP